MNVLTALVAVCVLVAIGYWLAVAFPPVSAYTMRSAMARFLRALAMLLDAGLGMSEAIARAAAAAGNPLFKRDGAPAIAQIANGATLDEAFARSRYLSPVSRGMIAIGEQTGRLPDCLRKAAEWHAQEADHFARVTTVLVEAVLILAIGAAIILTKL